MKDNGYTLNSVNNMQDEQVQFRKHMKNAVELMKLTPGTTKLQFSFVKGDELNTSIVQEINKAFGYHSGIPKERREAVKQSILRQRILPKIKEEDREKFTKAFTPQALETLYMHDTVLNYWAEAL
jgi:hypothetical protein